MVESESITEQVEPGKLIPYSNNPKKHPEEQVNKLASSIKNYGFRQHIVVDEDYEIIIGHGRLQAAKKLGLDTVPVEVADDLSKAEANQLRVLDNKTAETEYDDEKLARELDKIRNDDAFEQFKESMDEGEMSEYLDSLTDEEDLEEPESEDPETVETDIQEGEVFKLGEHRLMCGDATNESHVETLMDGEKADMVFTDPPYGINVVENSGVLQGDSSKPSKQLGDNGKCYGKKYNNVKSDDSTKTAEQHIKIIENYSQNMIIWGGNYFTEFLSPSRGWIVWDKDNGGSDFADCEIAWTSYDKSTRIYKWTWNGMIRQGDKKTEGTARVHPTQKPVGLTGEILDKFTEDVETIIDCFAGSGTTLLAAEQTSRKAYCMELDPQYCQVIINRWEELTGKEHEVVKQ